MIESYLLEALRAVYETGTLSAAAEQLHVAEPSVSRAMKKLEGILSVPLFQRQKNRVVLNETGRLAAEYAGRILDSEAEMIRQVQRFDRSLRTITVGACAPGPVMELLPQLTGIYPDMAISSDIAAEAELIEGLQSARYNLILLSRPLLQDGFYCRLHTTEQLYLSVHSTHPAASREAIRFAEMDGERFIMYAQVGVWEDIVRAKMPGAKFFKQEDMDAVGELAAASDLPGFTTDISLRILPSRRSRRVNIPFSDPEAFMQFYLVCREQDRMRFRQLFTQI